jgi:hypothetical protein
MGETLRAIKAITADLSDWSGHLLNTVFYPQPHSHEHSVPFYKPADTQYNFATITTDPHSLS